jgi:DNA invertase Pin-like site-specific DNA recombinase
VRRVTVAYTVEMKCVAYVRVSSRAQDLGMQRAAIEKMAASRGDSIETWFAEKASGKALARPELARLRSMVRDGNVKRLYVFKLDRLTRSGVADTYRMVDELRCAGCSLVAVADNLTIRAEADDIVSETLVFALALAARLERAAINDRIAAARERVEAEGRSWGRPRRLSSGDCERLRALRDQGRSVRDIAVAMKVPRSTVARALTRPGRVTP